jgi:hypothetical protein
VNIDQAIAEVEAKRIYVIGMHPFDLIRCLKRIADMPIEQIIEAPVRGLVTSVHESTLAYGPDTESFLVALDSGEMWSDDDALPWLNEWPTYESCSREVERVIEHQLALRSPSRKLEKFLQKDMARQARLLVKIS